jgi:hypothetical protein
MMFGKVAYLEISTVSGVPLAKVSMTTIPGLVEAKIGGHDGREVQGQCFQARISLTGHGQRLQTTNELHTT